MLVEEPASMAMAAMELGQERNGTYSDGTGREREGGCAAHQAGSDVVERSRGRRRQPGEDEEEVDIHGVPRWTGDVEEDRLERDASLLPSTLRSTRM